MLDQLRDGIQSLIGRQPRFFLEIEDAPITEVVKFDVEEKVSAPFNVYVKLASATEISFGKVRGREARLKITGDITDRLFHGVVKKFKQTGMSKSGKYLYRTEIVPILICFHWKRTAAFFRT